jgi:hypothetical protein
MDELKEPVVCNGCGWRGEGSDCNPALGVYHDLLCPRCGMSNLDTSGIRKAWAAQGRTYGYGDSNFLEMKGK